MKPSSMLPRLGILLLLGVGTAASHARAAAIDFDFESTPATETSFNPTGALSSLVMTNSGLTVTLTRQRGVAFDVLDSSAFPGEFPTSWGVHSLDPFYNESSATGFIANFSALASNVSIDLGDFGGDSDTFLLTAYSGLNGTGTVLATTTLVYGTQSLPTAATAMVAATGIQSVIWNDVGVGTGTNPDTYYNSLFYDNLTVTSAVPEPSTWALMTAGAGILAFGVARNRRNAQVA